MSREELSQLTVRGELIPTLSEVLTQLSGNALMNLELKDPEASSAVIEALQSLNETTKQGILVSSFNHEALEKVHRALPDLPIGVLSDHLDESLISTAKSLSALSINLPLSAVDPASINSIHSEGFKCLVFTVNTQRQAERCRKSGVDGIFTDYPERFMRKSKGNDWSSAL